MKLSDNRNTARSRNSLTFRNKLEQVTLEPWFLHSDVHQNHLKGLLKHRLLSLVPHISDLTEGLKWRLKICISNKFLNDADNVTRGLLWKAIHLIFRSNMYVKKLKVNTQITKVYHLQPKEGEKGE